MPRIIAYLSTRPARIRDSPTSNQSFIQLLFCFHADNQHETLRLKHTQYDTASNPAPKSYTMTPDLQVTGLFNSSASVNTTQLHEHDLFQIGKIKQDN